jgi:asparagine synthase (glutamine-hydrolysing)
MVSADDRFVLTFNGEIYNYKELRREFENLGCVFRSASDTEVLLQSWALWGESCIPRLKGMFAFAVLDKIEQRLTCVKDAFGIKPLFYANSSSGFFFASELPALQTLIGLPAKMNQSVMLDYLISGRYDLG